MIPDSSKFFILISIFALFQKVYFGDIKFILETIFMKTKMGNYFINDKINNNWLDLAIHMSLIVSTGLFEVKVDPNYGPYILYNKQKEAKLFLMCAKSDILNCSDGLRLTTEIAQFYQKFER